MSVGFPLIKSAFAPKRDYIRAIGQRIISGAHCPISQLEAFGALRRYDIATSDQIGGSPFQADILARRACGNQPNAGEQPLFIRGASDRVKMPVGDVAVIGFSPYKKRNIEINSCPQGVYTGEERKQKCERR